MKSFTAGKNEQDVRLSRFVESVTANLPQSLLYKSFRNKRVKVNGKRAAPDDRLAVGDVVELYINDEFFTNVQAAKPMPKKPPKITVIYEDANIAALYKPAHLLCHGDHTGDASLVDGFIAYLAAKNEYQADAEASFTPAICNRLDRGTEGLVLAAKNYAALRGRHIAYLRHFEKDNKVLVQKHPANGYKEIITDVAVLAVKGPLTLCKIGLITGRTHQIRAHLAFLNAPVLGDIKYGNRKLNERYGVKTQALCAFSVTFKDIPRENTLADLSKNCICLENPEIEKLFKRLP